MPQRLHVEERQPLHQVAIGQQKHAARILGNAFLHPVAEIGADRIEQSVQSAIIAIDELLVATGAPGDRIDAEALAALLGEKIARRPEDGIFGVSSEEQTTELQSIMRISYAVFCLQ